MTIQEIEDAVDYDSDILVCIYCDREVDDTYCHNCNEYKGIVTSVEWELITGESWF